MLDYDTISRVSSPPLELQERMFEEFIKPLLNNPKKLHQPEYFFHEGWLAWRLGVTQKHMRQVSFVESLCMTLYQDHPGELMDLVACITAEQYEVNVRTEQYDRSLFSARQNNKTEELVVNQLGMYKALFENGFRLFSTLPYFYRCKYFKIKHKGTTPETFTNIGASEKFVALRDCSISLAEGDFSELVDGFDNHLRNAGAGHDRWEITDDNTVILTVVDPKSGVTKKTAELTSQNLNDHIKQVRRGIWVLRNGIMMFLENNQQALEDFELKKKFKLREIRDYTRTFADNRCFNILGFELEQDSNRLSLEIQYNPQIIGEGTQLFLGGHEAYDVIHKVESVEYHFQMLGIMKYVLSFFAEDERPSIEIKMRDESGEELGDVLYDKDELEKLFVEEGEPQIPVPASGSVPSKQCRIVTSLRVPYGMGATMKRIMREEEGWEMI